MPPLPPAAFILKVRFRGNYGPATYNNLLHVRYTGTAPASGDLTTYAAAVAAQWNAHLAPLANTSVTLVGVDVTDLSSATSAQVETTQTGTGTRVGQPFTAQVCMVASWSGQLRYRGGHFRTYWPFGQGADAFTSQQWTVAFQNEATAALRAFRTGMNGLSVGTATTQLVGLSYKTGHAFRPAPLAVVLNDVLVHPRVDTQRRRLGKERI